MKVLISNKYFIPLTRISKKIVQFFEEKAKIDTLFTENSAKIRQMMSNFLSLPALQTNLGILQSFWNFEFNH